MKVISLVYEQEFKGKSYKDAYKKATKWVASNIIANNIEVTWKIVKIPVELTTKVNGCRVKLSLFVELDIEDHFIKRCNVCTSFHTKFYINQQMNCDKCNAKALLDTAKDKLKIKKQYIKEKIQEGS